MRENVEQRGQAPLQPGGSCREPEQFGPVPAESWPTVPSPIRLIVWTLDFAEDTEASQPNGRTFSRVLCSSQTPARRRGVALCSLLRAPRKPPWDSAAIDSHPWAGTSLNPLPRLCPEVRFLSEFTVTLHNSHFKPPQVSRSFHVTKKDL